MWCTIHAPAHVATAQRFVVPGTPGAIAAARVIDVRREVVNLGEKATLEVWQWNHEDGTTQSEMHIVEVRSGEKSGPHN